MPRASKVIWLRGGAMKLTAFMTVIVIAAAVVFTSACGSSTEVAHAAQRTQARVYYAFNAAGRPAIRVTRRVRGSCWTGSLAINRNDAWRCFAGNNVIADPCFSSGKTKGIVLCPAPSAAWRSGVKINLTRGLPRRYGHKRGPSKSGKPWGIQTTSGLRCVLGSGAAPIVGKRRANYGCGPSRQFLWGAPQRNFKLWRIYIAPINARKLTRKAEIRTAWF